MDVIRSFAGLIVGAIFGIITWPIAIILCGISFYEPANKHLKEVFSIFDEEYLFEKMKNFFVSLLFPLFTIISGAIVGYEHAEVFAAENLGRNQPISVFDFYFGSRAYINAAELSSPSKTFVIPKGQVDERPDQYPALCAS